MTESVDTRPTALRFFNQHLIRISKLNIKAYYAYHACAHKCFVKDPTNKYIKQCTNACSNELDDYFTYSNNNRPYDANVFALSGYQTSQQKDQYEYRRTTAVLSDSINQYADSLENKIDTWINKNK